MNLDDDEILTMLKDGAKLHVVPIEKPSEQPAGKPSGFAQMVSEFRTLTAALLRIASREDPEVNVAAPQVSVKPTITVESPKAPRKWRFEVTERDNTAEQRIKVFTAEAIE